MFRSGAEQLNPRGQATMATDRINPQESKNEKRGGNADHAEDLGSPVHPNTTVMEGMEVLEAPQHAREAPVSSKSMLTIGGAAMVAVMIAQVVFSPESMIVFLVVAGVGALCGAATNALSITNAR